MIDINEAKKYLTDWVINFLDMPQEKLNNISACPYAKHAVVNGKIKFVTGGENIIDDMIILQDNWDSSYDGVVIIYDPSVDVNRFSNSVEYVNDNYYRHSGLIALEDHPEIDETIAGINFNNGKYAIIIVQYAEKLRKANEILKSKGYYINWTRDDLDVVVNWRW